MSKWRGNPWAILLTLSLGFFMTLLDLTIVNIAIPNMMDELGVSYDEVLWVINGYALVLAVLLITGGRLGDILGKRHLYLAGVALFTVASLLCGFSQSSAELIGARAAQGLGAAMLMPQTMSIVIGVFPAERRGAALGVWSSVAGVAAIAGPTVGGLLVTAFDWRWIFFVNLPVGVLVLALAPLVIPVERRKAPRRSFDLRGVLLVSVALFCLSFGLEEGQRFHWGRVWSVVSIPMLLVAGGVLLVGFGFAERARQKDEPLLPFRLFADRDFALSNVTTVALSVGLIGMSLGFTIYLQSVLGMSALSAGLTMAPMSLLTTLVAPMAGRLSDRTGGRYILMGGLTLSAGGIAMIAVVSRADTSRWELLPGLLLIGFGMGATFAPLSTIAMRNVSPRLAGAASGVMNTTRQLGSVMATASVGALLQNRLAVAFVDQAQQRAADLPAQTRGPFVSGFAGAATHGLRLGAGQSGGTVSLPAGTSTGVSQQVEQVARQVFTHGFVHALHVTLVLPTVVLLLGAVSCLFLTRRGQTADAPATGRASTASATHG
jgi:drug resistance transporter, EmrB/QacA subfamily